MFDEITLVVIEEYKNANKAVKTREVKRVVQAQSQTVSRKQRDIYGERGLGFGVRFKINFVDDLYYNNIPYFYHRGRKYATTDFIKDVTSTSYFIEGVSAQKKESGR